MLAEGFYTSPTCSCFSIVVAEDACISLFHCCCWGCMYFIVPLLLLRMHVFHCSIVVAEDACISLFHCCCWWYMYFIVPMLFFRMFLLYCWECVFLLLLRMFVFYCCCWWYVIPQSLTLTLLPDFYTEWYMCTNCIESVAILQDLGNNVSE